ncbi:NUDIX hydrolase domain-like protein [Delphinella strobiligena]|nr:NUDIX hydrolase domain-like protein [Delphinella strobiligena]
MASLSNARVQSQTPLEIKDTKWIQLIKTTYTSADGKTREWESAVRSTRPKESLVDAVGVIAILEKSSGPELLLQKQYRPPIDKISIEVPAGLVDQGESPKEAALRELKEETGYIGEVIEGQLGLTPTFFNDPGFTNTNTNMVHVKIDMSRPENQKLKPALEESEFIECFSVPLVKLYDECRKLESEGFAIDARVGSLAEGIEVARQWRLT